MPQLDASIIGGFKPIETPDPTNLLIKGLQAQGLMGQNQLQQLQIGQQQQAYERQNALMQYLGSPQAGTDDLGTRVNKVASLDPINGPKIIESYLNTQKTQGDIAKTQQDVEHQQIIQTGSILGAAAATGNPQNVIDTITKSPTIPETQRSALLAQAQRDPIAFAQQFAMGTMTANEQAVNGRPGVIESPLGPVAYNKSNPTAGYFQMGPTNGGQPAPAAPVQPQMPAQQSTPGYPSVSPQQQTQRNAAALQLIMQEKSNPQYQNPKDQAALDAEIARLQNGAATGQPFAQNGPQATPVSAVASQGQPASQTAPQAAAAPVNPFMKFEKVTDPTTNRVMMVSTTPGPDGNFVTKPITSDGSDFKPTAADQALIDQIGQGKIAFPSSNSRLPHQEQILAAVAQQYPQTTAADYPAMLAAQKSFTPGGKNGMVVRSLGVASEHLDTLSQAASAMNNGQVPIVNKIVNTFGYNTGNTAASTFDALKEIVGDEVVKAVIGGAGGMGDRDAIKATLSNAKTPQQLANVIQGYRTLMQAQLTAQQQDYEQSTHRTDFATRFNYGSKPAAAPAGWNVQVVSQ